MENQQPVGSDAWLTFSQNFSPEKCPEELCRVRVQIAVQDYKSLRVAVMIWATLVNTQTHTHRQLLTNYAISS